MDTIVYFVLLFGEYVTEISDINTVVLGDFIYAKPHITIEQAERTINTLCDEEVWVTGHSDELVTRADVRIEVYRVSYTKIA